MSNFRTYPVTSDVGLMDERNERPVLIALVAILVAWLAVCVAVTSVNYGLKTMRWPSSQDSCRGRRTRLPAG